jgi:hypothetical protein
MPGNGQAAGIPATSTPGVDSDCFRPARLPSVTAAPFVRFAAGT